MSLCPVETCLLIGLANLLFKTHLCHFTMFTQLIIYNTFESDVWSTDESLWSSGRHRSWALEVPGSIPTATKHLVRNVMKYRTWVVDVFYKKNCLVSQSMKVNDSQGSVACFQCEMSLGCVRDGWFNQSTLMVESPTGVCSLTQPQSLLHLAGAS